jgi:DNA-binding protein H-NS
MEGKPMLPLGLIDISWKHNFTLQYHMNVPCADFKFDIYIITAARLDPTDLSANKSNLNKTKEKQNQILKRKRSTEKHMEFATKQDKNNYYQKTADTSGMTSIKDLTSTRTSQERQKRPMMYSQITADASGVTSIKDLTSTRTSQERRKQPIMYQALRKELVNFLNDTTQVSPNRVVLDPTPQRKRVTAPPTKRNTSLVIFTPMPLYCGGSAIAGSGMHKSKGRNFSLGKFVKEPLDTKIKGDLDLQIT